MDWIENKDNNMGLVIKANLNEKPDKELQLNDIGLVSSRGDDEFQPFMVGFFKGQEVSRKFKFLQQFNLKFNFTDDKTKS
jgi:TGF-beta propeptide